MQTSTPPSDPRNDLQHDPNGKHGDVDKNGDLVDELHGLTVGEIAARELALEHRLRDAICATGELADDQLRAVKQLVRPWTVTL